jgi:hypothetical protein
LWNVTWISILEYAMGKASKAKKSQKIRNYGDDGVPVDGASAEFALLMEKYAYLGQRLYHCRAAYRIWVTSGKVNVTDFERPPTEPPTLSVSAGMYVDLIKIFDQPIKILGDAAVSTVRVSLMGFPSRP